LAFGLSSVLKNFLTVSVTLRGYQIVGKFLKILRKEVRENIEKWKQICYNVITIFGDDREPPWAWKR
jgi:hypothetical protein